MGTLAAVEELKQWGHAESLDEPAPGLDDGPARGDLTPDQRPTPLERLAAGELEQRVAGLLAELPAREGYVVARRFGLDGDPPATLQEIADVFGVTHERIRQIEGKALRRLAGPLRPWSY